MTGLHQERQGWPFRQHWLGLLMVWTGALQIVLDKGQEDDWFGATWVRWAVTCAGGRAHPLDLALVGHPKGLVDLHVTEGPQLPHGMLFDRDAGHGHLYNHRHSAALLPEVMGYTAFTAGLVGVPRASIVLSARRWLAFSAHALTSGQAALRRLLGFGVCALSFGLVNLDIGPYTLLIPITLPALP